MASHSVSLVGQTAPPAFFPTSWPGFCDPNYYSQALLPYPARTSICMGHCASFHGRSSLFNRESVQRRSLENGWWLQPATKARKRVPTCAAAGTVPLVDTAAGKDAVLEKVKDAVGFRGYEGAERVVVKGQEEHRGMESSWTMSFDMSGRFYEESAGLELANSFGFDASSKDSAPWEADHAGRVSLLELDDKEMLLLDMWIRTSFWLTEKAEDWLSVELEEENALEAVFSIKLVQGAVVGKLHVDKSTWLPQSLVASAYGSSELWQYKGWGKMLPVSPCKFPATLIRTPVAGGSDTIIVTSFAFAPANASLYQKPAEPVQRPGYVAQEVSWDPEVSSKVPVRYTSSGHMLVRPKVDGQDLGYFVFDSGASGLTIKKEEGDRLSMSSFGEIYVAVIGGEFQCPFRRGNSFQLGPLRISNPLFLEIPADQVVTETLDAPVVGICGYDVFHSAVVEMSVSPVLSLTLHRPEEFETDADMLAMFQRLYVVGCVPQCSAQFGRHSGLFMLDTGAGGVDVIFPRRAVEKYELMKGRVRQGAARVRGVPHTEQDECFTIHQAEFHHFVLGGYAFDTPRQALFALDEQDGFDLSEHTCGIICLDMLKGFRIFFDYSNRRIAFIRERRYKDKAPEDYKLVEQWQHAFGTGIDMGDKAWEL